MRRCAICGKWIYGKDGSTDHVFPRAIYKWLKCCLPAEEHKMLEELIESPENKLAAHMECNALKNDLIPDENDLYLDAMEREQLASLRKKMMPYIIMYRKGKGKMFRKQHDLCYCCHKRLGECQVLRRIDPSRPHVWQNGCVVCHECNMKNRDFLNTKIRRSKHRRSKNGPVK